MTKSAIQTWTKNYISNVLLSGQGFESITEVADYPIEVLFSDVGGTAGLILGMSFATVLGLIDIAIQWVIGDGPSKFVIKVILFIFYEFLKPWRFFKIWRIINEKLSTPNDKNDGFKRIKLNQATSISPSINRHPFNLRNMVNMHLGTAFVLSHGQMVCHPPCH